MTQFETCPWCEQPFSGGMDAGMMRRFFRRVAEKRREVLEVIEPREGYFEEQYPLEVPVPVSVREDEGGRR